MAVEWPITPIIDQSPISRLCNFFTAARKKQEAQKVAAAKWLRKRKGTGQEKKFRTGNRKKIRFMRMHQINMLYIFATDLREIKMAFSAELRTI